VKSKKAIGGEYELSRMGDSPMAGEVKPEDRNKGMHASFKGSGFKFMASDGRTTKVVDPEEGNISLSLATEDKAEGERVFKALSDGGKVLMPLGEAFWGGTFGMLIDRFGIEWMITIG